jgi:hypothetical protein
MGGGSFPVVRGGCFGALCWCGRKGAWECGGALDEVRAVFDPYFLAIKAVHVLAASLWAFSTAVAYSYFVKPAFRRVERRPNDPGVRAIRDRSMEAFDRGAAIEHWALLVMVVTAILLLWLGRVDLTRWNSVTAMLWIGVLVILPMEGLDIYLAHLGGNKERIRQSGDLERYERMLARHRTFLRATEPVIMILVPAMFFIAIAKPF